MTIHTDRLARALDRGVADGSDAVANALPIDDAIPDVVARRVLDNGRRRAVVRYLLTADEPITIPRLVARIADDEHETTALTSVHDLRQRIHVSLCRTHLPLLEHYRLLSYDPADGVVAPGARLAAFESILETSALE